MVAADPDVHDGEQPLRADARRNREQIIDAARTMFAEQGVDVPMDEIARRAGVGVGTLYRRFPDRDALIRAVAMDAIGWLHAEARAAWQEEPSAWDALVRILRQSGRLRVAMQLTMFSRRAATLVAEDPDIHEQRRSLVTLLDEVVRAAQEEGALRRDVGTGDVAIVFALLMRSVPTGSDEIARLVQQRCLGLLLDGLRAPANGDLPGQPLTADDIRLGR